MSELRRQRAQSALSAAHTALENAGRTHDALAVSFFKLSFELSFYHLNLDTCTL